MNKKIYTSLLLLHALTFFTMCVFSLFLYKTTQNNSRLSEDMIFAKDWRDVLDPRTDLFWREGNHVPDQGIILLLQDPTLENAKKYVQRMNTKQEKLLLITALIEQAQKELQVRPKNDSKQQPMFADIDPDKKEDLMKSEGTIATAQPPVDPSSINWDDLDIYFFFDTECPKCHSLADSLTGIPAIIPKQVSINKGIKNFTGLSESSLATQASIEEYVKDDNGNIVVPRMVFVNRKNGQVRRVTGNVGRSIVFSTASKMVN